MSNEPSFNRELREAFKTEIGYADLLRRPPAEIQVLLDWRGQLQGITDTTGQTWRGQFEQPQITPKGAGHLTGRFQSAAGEILFKVTALPGNWRERLDQVMFALSLTDRGQVNLKRKDQAADLYLVPKNSPPANSVHFLFGGFYVKLSAWEEENVEPLALALLQLMRANSRPADAGNPPVFALQSPSAVQAGTEFTVVLKGLPPDWNANWIFAQPDDLLPKAVEYVDQQGDRFEFRAQQAGRSEIPFVALNTKTLQLSREILLINPR